MTASGSFRGGPRKMSVLRTVIATALLLSGLVGSRCGDDPPSPPADQRAGLPANTLTEQEVREGWLLLFDGRSLEGWRGLGRSGPPEGAWMVQDGCLARRPEGDELQPENVGPAPWCDLISVRTFEDFDLHFDWKIGPGGNSGVKYNVSEEISLKLQPPGAALGFEYQILDDERDPDAAARPCWAAAALYDLVAPRGKTVRPVGEFNTARVVIRGNRGEHWLNGVKVLEFDLGTAEMRRRLAESKYRDISGFGRRRRGHISLQDHGHAVWFCNIRIRELPPGSPPR